MSDRTSHLEPRVPNFQFRFWRLPPDFDQLKMSMIAGASGFGPNPVVIISELLHLPPGPNSLQQTIPAGLAETLQQRPSRCLEDTTKESQRKALAERRRSIRPLVIGNTSRRAGGTTSWMTSIHRERRRNSAASQAASSSPHIGRPQRSRQITWRAMVLQLPMAGRAKTAQGPSAGASCGLRVVPARGEDVPDLKRRAATAFAYFFRRCHRLNKSCRPAAPGRRITRKPTLSPGPDQLQKKLDEFAALLRASGHDDFAKDVTAAFQQRISKPFQPDLPKRTDASLAASSAPARLSSCLGPSTNDPCSASYGLADTPLPSPEPSAEDSEMMFQSFCSGNLRFFPFVNFAPGTTAADTRRDWPFLWANIMMIKLKTPTYQRACGKHVREILAKKLILDHDRSMDLLMGLMAYIGWYVLLTSLSSHLTVDSHSTHSDPVLPGLFTSRAPSPFSVCTLT